MYKRSTLKNGLRIIASPMKDRESAAIGIWIKVGGRYEDFKDKGISHFMEHMLFKGSRKYSCRMIKESIEGIGGSLNGFTSEEVTCFLAKVPVEYLDTALQVLSSMVLEPELSPKEIIKEKTVIIEEIKMYRDQPQSYVYELLDELMWPKQPLGYPIIGSEESVSSVDRKKLQEFRKQYYNPSNIVISVAGSFDFNKLNSKIGRIFSLGQAAGESQFQPAVERQSRPQLKIFFKETEQTHMALGLRSFARNHPLKHALNLLHIILGANMSSRLFEELREKRGLAYEIGTAVKRFNETGAFIVHAGIDNHKVIPALKLILKELGRIKNDAVSADEFKRAREFYLGQLKLALEDTMDYMLWMGESMACLDKAYTVREIEEEVKSVSAKQVRLAAEAVFNNKNLSLSLIGPLKGMEPQVGDCLNIG